MKKSEVAQMIDHIPLKPGAGGTGVAGIVKEGAELGTYFVCVSPPMPPFEVPEGFHVACVAGFSSGAVKPEIKTAEAVRAVEGGTDEVDTVINLALVKEGQAKELEAEAGAIWDAVPAPRIPKVTTESTALSGEEIIMTCKASEAMGADFVKTSTGFHPAGGAFVHIVRFIREAVGNWLGMKASGGIHNGKTVLEMIEAEASRLGVPASLTILADIERWE